MAISNFRVRSYITNEAIFDWDSIPADIARLTMYSAMEGSGPWTNTVPGLLQGQLQASILLNV